MRFTTQPIAYYLLLIISKKYKLSCLGNGELVVGQTQVPDHVFERLVGKFVDNLVRFLCLSQLIVGFCHLESPVGPVVRYVGRWNHLLGIVEGGKRLLANANWERPIYMAITVGSENHLGMDNHFVQEGLAYRFTPFETDKLNSKIDSEKMYDNLMNKFKFGGIDKPGIYIDENVMRMCYTHRRIFTQLVGQQ